MSDELAARLVEVRKALKLTQDEFSGRTGIPLSTLKKYEGSHREPGADAMGLLSAAGIDINWLLTGAGQMLLGESKADGVREPEAVYSVSRAAIDPLLLQGVIDFFYGWLDEHKDRVRIDRSRHGAVISVLYTVAERGGVIRKAELEQVLGLAA